MNGARKRLRFVRDAAVAAVNAITLTEEHVGYFVELIVVLPSGSFRGTGIAELVLTLNMFK